MYKRFLCQKALLQVCEFEEILNTVLKFNKEIKSSQYLGLMDEVAYLSLYVGNTGHNKNR